MAKLCANIEMFTLNQDIFFVDDHNIKHVAAVPIDRMGETIYSLVGEKGEIKEVELNGNKDFIQIVGCEILEGLKKFYSNTDVRVKLNGEIFN